MSTLPNLVITKCLQYARAFTFNRVISINVQILPIPPVEVHVLLRTYQSWIAVAICATAFLVTPPVMHGFECMGALPYVSLPAVKNWRIQVCYFVSPLKTPLPETHVLTRLLLQLRIVVNCTSVAFVFAILARSSGRFTAYEASCLLRIAMNLILGHAFLKIVAIRDIGTKTAVRLIFPALSYQAHCLRFSLIRSIG